MTEQAPVLPGEMKSGVVFTFQGRTYDYLAAVKSTSVPQPKDGEKPKQVEKVEYVVGARHPSLIFQKMGVGSVAVKAGRAGSTIKDIQKVDPGDVLLGGPYDGLKVLLIVRIDRERLGTYWVMGDPSCDFRDTCLIHDTADWSQVKHGTEEETRTHRSLMEDQATEETPEIIPPVAPPLRGPGGVFLEGVEYEVAEGRPAGATTRIEYDDVDGWEAWFIDGNGATVGFEDQEGRIWVPADDIEDESDED